MPHYGYRCQSCQREFEMLQRMSDPPMAACPECGGAGTRLFYPTGILFKGTGFYKTDSRSTTPATAPAAGETAKPATEPAPAKPATEPSSAPAKPASATPKPSAPTPTAGPAPTSAATTD